MWLRTASERDLSAIQTLLAQTWHATYDGIYGVARVNVITAEWHSTANLKARLAQPHSEFLVADGDKGIIGMAFASQSNPDFVMLHQLYVHPAAQRQGVGSALLGELLTAFPGAKAFRLEVEAANLGAVRFYEVKGFVPLSRTENCGQAQSGIPAVVMQKQLV